MFMGAKMLYEFMKTILDKNTSVVTGDVPQILPVSSEFGIDRGKPIDRYYIENFLKKHKHNIKGHVLEVGYDKYSKSFGKGKLDKIDVLCAAPGNKYTTIIGDLTDTKTLPQNYYDCFICTQTYNYIFDVKKAIEGSYYLLKDGGVLLATVTGISQISSYDMKLWGDYWKFTTASIQRLFSEVFRDENFKVESFGNVLAATAFLQGLSVEDLPDTKLLDYNDPNYQLTITVIATKADL